MRHLISPSIYGPSSSPFEIVTRISNQKEHAITEMLGLQSAPLCTSSVSVSTASRATSWLFASITLCVDGLREAKYLRRAACCSVSPLYGHVLIDTVRDSLRIHFERGVFDQFESEGVSYVGLRFSCGVFAAVTSL
jgi:hypothetical protein